MKINITGNQLDLTPSLTTYIEEKLGALHRLVQHFDAQGSAELRVEVSRTTHHHRKGDVFKAAGDLTLPEKVIRAEAEAEDIRMAIDMLKDKLYTEIEKNKERHEGKADSAEKRAMRGK